MHGSYWSLIAESLNQFYYSPPQNLVQLILWSRSQHIYHKKPQIIKPSNFYILFLITKLTLKHLFSNVRKDQRQIKRIGGPPKAIKEEIVFKIIGTPTVEAIHFFQNRHFFND
ncbi:hypothetical protein V6Z12_A02G074800 [Gossypium hirsutum]